MLRKSIWFLLHSAFIVRESGDMIKSWWKHGYEIYSVHQVEVAQFYTFNY